VTCQDARVPAGYSYVDGDELTSLALDVRREFLHRPPCSPDDARRPNSVRLVALDLIERRSTHQQLSALADLIDRNPGLTVTRDEDRDIFEHSDTPANFVADLICEVIWQILARDSEIREEDQRRCSRAIARAERRDDS
jgi:hypothetical protein